MGVRVRQHQSRSGPSAFVYVVLGLALLACGGLGFALKGSHVAYEKLWDRLKAQGVQRLRAC